MTDAAKRPVRGVYQRVELAPASFSLFFLKKRFTSNHKSLFACLSWKS